MLDGDGFISMQERFDYFSKHWKEETRFLSSSTAIYENRWNLKIMKYGEEMLPYIFASMKKKPDWWFWTINTIVGRDKCPIIPNEMLGQLDKLTELYLQWGKEKGYV